MFELFNTWHLLALGAIALAAGGFATLPRQPGVRPYHRLIGWAIVAGMVVNESIWVTYLWRIDAWDVQHTLPLHLCDLAIIAGGLALLTERQTLYELTYYWGLGASVQAILTPGLAADVSAYEFLRYFLSHGGILVVVAYLTGARRMRPSPASVPRCVLITLGCMVGVGGVDWLVGANYMFLRKKPGAASVMDYLGPWPWYVLSLIGLGVVSMLVLYAPWYASDRVKRRTAAP